MPYPDGAPVILQDTISNRGCLSSGNASVVAFYNPKDQKFTAYTWGSDHRRGADYRERLKEGYRIGDSSETIEKISIYMENLMATQPFVMKGFLDYNLRPGKSFMHEPSERLNNAVIGNAIREQIAEVNARYR